ncbi:MAG TPA: hypothetical protein VNS32_26460 [Flavisolibacter sp.]|nr:hypothetical protein [Flavisolibacter sp.]
MKKTFVFVLLLCLLLTVFGYQVVFQLQITEAKSEMKQHIHSALYSKVYTDLIFDQQQVSKIIWMEEDEFKWNGELYDVIGKEIIDDHLVIRCIQDNKETLLVNQYLKSCNNNNGAEHLPSASLLKLISTYFLYTSIEVPPSMQHRILKIYKPYSFYILANILPVSTPPPKVC